MENEYINATSNAIALITIATKEMMINVSYETAIVTAEQLGTNLTDSQKHTILERIKSKSEQNIDLFIKAIEANLQQH